MSSAGSPGDQVLVKFRQMDGSITEAQAFDSVDPVRALSRYVKRTSTSCTSRPEWPELILEQTVLPQGLSLSEVALPSGCTLDVVWGKPRAMMTRWRAEQDPLRVRTFHAEVEQGQGSESDGRLDLSGYRCPEVPWVQSLLAGAVVPVVAVDVSQCRLESDAVVELFASLPPTVTELRASRNAVSQEALEVLKHNGLHFRVLDIGLSECQGFSSLPDLVGELTEELGLAELPELLHLQDMMVSILSRCPRLKKISAHVSLGEDDIFTIGSHLLDTLSKHCHYIEAIDAHGCDCSSASVATLLTSCPRLQELVLTEGCTKSNIATMSHMRWLDKVHVEVTTAADMIEAARLNVDQLFLGARCPDELDNNLELWLDPIGGREAAADLLAAAFSESSVLELGLGLPFHSQSLLRAAGPRLQMLEAVDWCERGDGVEDESILALLALAPECCKNLRHLKLHAWEQINTALLSDVAQACANLEVLDMTADDSAFQQQPIDEGILAIGAHCHQLIHLDLHMRTMAEPWTALAQACTGWPQLRYLCAAYTFSVGGRLNDWVAGDPDLVLPAALAANCPALETVAIYDDAALQRWHPILLGGCPSIQPLEED